MQALGCAKEAEPAAQAANGTGHAMVW